MFIQLVFCSLYFNPSVLFKWCWCWEAQVSLCPHPFYLWKPTHLQDLLLGMSQCPTFKLQHSSSRWERRNVSTQSGTCLSFAIYSVSMMHASTVRAMCATWSVSNVTWHQSPVSLVPCHQCQRIIRVICSLIFKIWIMVFGHLYHP